jgi:hypothetical protein
MKPSYLLKYKIIFPVLFCFLTASPTIAVEYEKIITESYVKNEFNFQDGELFKYSKCENKSNLSCKYIWGIKSKKDAKRVQMGLPPDGNQLSVIYAKAKQEKDFSRVLSSYTDAVDIDGLGVKAVWSDKRQQLSMITKSNLIVHIHTKVKGMSNTKNKAVSVAQHILNQL